MPYTSDTVKRNANITDALFQVWRLKAEVEQFVAVADWPNTAPAQWLHTEKSLHGLSMRQAV